MLILFDIDGTLISTGGAGRRAIERAGKDLFNQRFTTRGLAVSGRVDPAIFRDALVMNELPPSMAHYEALRNRYFEHLEITLEESERVVLPGVFELIAALQELEDLTLGLLTGNFEVSGRRKLEVCGIAPERFVINAFGDDASGSEPHRRDLPPAASKRFLEAHGHAPREVVIIGDTIHDVDCARAHGHRSLAVTTGTNTREEFANSGASLVLDDLNGTGKIVDWLAAS